jgi:hypothetical protein
MNTWLSEEEEKNRNSPAASQLSTNSQRGCSPPPVTPEFAYQTSGSPQQKMHLVVADGRFDAQQDLECQDKLVQKLYQVAAGLYL